MLRNCLGFEVKKIGVNKSIDFDSEAHLSDSVGWGSLSKLSIIRLSCSLMPSLYMITAYTAKSRIVITVSGTFLREQ